MSGAPHEKEFLVNYAKVPIRTGSKRGLEQINADKSKAIMLDKYIEREAKKMIAAGSFDSKYWTKLGEVSELRLKRSQLSMRLLQDELAEGAFRDPDAEVKRLEAEERIHALEASIFKEQAARVEAAAGEEDKNRRGFFMRLWTTSKLGLGILGTETGRGNRSRRDQEKFREELIKACNSRSQDPKSDKMWCPVLCEWIDPNIMRAAHIFPWAAGQDAMDEIFGREEDKIEELSDIMNGMMLSQYVGERIEKGDIVIVPDVADAASEEQIDAWSVSEPKAYKIRVTNSASKGMDRYYPYNSKITWNEMDGRKLIFLSDHRPRPRYLYWQYCKTMLGMAWSDQAARAKTILMQERGKQFWGTRGPYMKKRMLLAFVEQLGHDHEALMMQNAITELEDDNNVESDPTALLLASAEIRNANRKHSEFEKEAEDEAEASDDDGSMS